MNIEGMRHAEVVAFIKRGGDETWLLVVDPETDEHFKSKGVVPTVSHVRGRTTKVVSYAVTHLMVVVISYKTILVAGILLFSQIMMVHQCPTAPLTLKSTAAPPHSPSGPHAPT